MAGVGILARPVTTYFGHLELSVWPSELIVIFTVALGPPVSQAADFWGRKWFLVILTASGAVGSVIVATAHSTGTLIFGYCAMSAAFGAQSLLFAVVSEVLPRKHRPTAQAVVNMTSGIGAFIGLAVGGTLLKNNHSENYRTFFYMETGIFAAAALACLFCYNPPPRELQQILTFSEKIRRLDWIGYTLFIPGLVLFSIALAWSQNPYSWKNAHILGPFICGVLLLIAFAIYEWRFKSDGMFHHGLFKNRNFPLTLVLIFTEGLSFFTTTNYFAFQFSLFIHVDLLEAGMAFGIVFLSTVVFAAVFGFYATKRRQFWDALLVGCLALLVFNILMATSKPSTPKPAYWGYPILAGVGLGAILPLSMAAVQLSTPAELISITSGLVLAVRSLGASIGIPTNNAIFSGTLTTQISSKVVPAVLGLGLPPSSLEMFIPALMANDQAALAEIPGVTPAIIGAAAQALVDGYAIAFRNVWITAAVFLFVAIIGKLSFLGLVFVLYQTAG